MVKRVLRDSSEVAHVWAQQTQDGARTPTGHCYFTGNTIYSYGTHFPMGVIMKDKKGRELVALNTDSYSVTTSKQKSYVRYAVNHKSCVNVDTRIIKLLESGTYTYFLGKKDKYGNSNITKRKELIGAVCWRARCAIKKAAESAIKRRKVSLKEEDINEALNIYKQGEHLLAFFSLKYPASIEKLKDKLVTDAAGLEAVYSHQLKLEKRARDKRDKLLQDARDASAIEAVELWRKGENSPFIRNRLYECSKVAMRINGEEIETSKGARFPVTHGLKAFALIKACKITSEGWQHKDKALHIGNFTIDSIEADGNVKAGCHYVEYSEIERIARELRVVV